MESSTDSDEESLEENLNRLTEVTCFLHSKSLTKLDWYFVQACRPNTVNIPLVIPTTLYSVLKVRNQYRIYLEKLLKSNYEEWVLDAMGFKEPPLEDDIKKCAEIYEMKALRSCQIAQFYRKSMLKIINRIRKETDSKKLLPKLKNIIQTVTPSCTDASTQTETNQGRVQDCGVSEEDTNNKTVNDMRYDYLSLQDKIKQFEERLKNRENENHLHKKRKRRSLRQLEAEIKRKKVRHKETLEPTRPSSLAPTISPICLTPATPVSDIQKMEDENIRKELDDLFREERTDFDDIFGSPEPDVDPRIENILKEIEQAKLHSKSMHTAEELAVSPTSAPKTQVEEEIELRDSKWPCELHLQRLKLREAFTLLSDSDLRWHDVLREKFIELFGEDEDDDDFAPYSPTLELNETLLGSCMKRIAPWIVKHLMKPLKDGLIGNRYLFKKLAKRLAHNIVIADQYPDEKTVKDFVEDFFCLRGRVDSVHDIDLD